MEGRDGLNCTLKPGCSTFITHAEHTHSDTNTQSQGALCKDVLMESPRWTDRETGPHRSLLCSHSQLKNTPSPQEQPPQDQTDMLLKTQTLRAFSPFPLRCSSKTEGYQGQEVTMHPSNPTAVFISILFLGVSNCSLYFGSVFSFEL